MSFDRMQRVLLWTTLSVLTLVTGGMGLIQHKSETDPNSNLKDHIFKGGSTVLYPWLLFPAMQLGLWRSRLAPL